MRKPMLAHKFDINRVDYTQPEGYYIQPKLDGIRCLFTADGAYSRNNKKFMNLKHIEMALKPFFEQHPDVVLDGELYNHELNRSSDHHRCSIVFTLYAVTFYYLRVFTSCTHNILKGDLHSS